MPTIQDALNQKSFDSERHQVLLNILYSSSWAKTVSSQALKPLGITWQQFNLLRILRGQKGQPASMRLLQDRMLDAQSNASRIVDKLEAKQYVSREVAPEDKRRVSVSLTAEGATLLQDASARISAAIEDLGGDLTPKQMLTLSDLLDRFRG